MSTPPTGAGDPPPGGEDSDDEELLGDRELDPFQEAVLAQPTRREIVRVVGEAPGLNKSQLARRVGIVQRTLDGHLGLLEWADLVEVKDGERDRERICFLASHEHLWEDEATAILYGQAPTRWVALFLAEHEPIRTEEVGDALGRTPEAVRPHLARLRERGLASRVRSAGTVFHVATDELRAWVAAWGDGYRRPWEEGEGGEEER